MQLNTCEVLLVVQAISLAWVAMLASRQHTIRRDLREGKYGHRKD